MVSPSVFGARSFGTPDFKQNFLSRRPDGLPSSRIVPRERGWMVTASVIPLRNCLPLFVSLKGVF